jgi:hypothetical protein
VSLVEVAVGFLELLVFALADFAFAAALRGWFKWPRLHERTTAFVASLLLAAPLILVGVFHAGVFHADSLVLTLAGTALVVNYFAILGGLRFVRPAASN